MRIIDSRQEDFPVIIDASLQIIAGGVHIGAVGKDPRFIALCMHLLVVISTMA